MKNENNYSTGRKKVQKNIPDVQYGSARKKGEEQTDTVFQSKQGAADFVMLFGVLVMVAYFSFSLSGFSKKDADQGNFQTEDAISVSTVGKGEKNEPATEQKWSFWKYLDESLEKFFKERGLL